jgi:hypothetical protein
LKFVVSKCFEMNALIAVIPPLLILVDRLCFDRDKIDYTAGQTANRGQLIWSLATPPGLRVNAQGDVS